MIKINTLTEEEIDKIYIYEIYLERKVEKLLSEKGIKTLSDLKMYVEKEGMIDFYLTKGFGSKSEKILCELLNHAYPNLYLGRSNKKKYTFR